MITFFANCTKSFISNLCVKTSTHSKPIQPSYDSDRGWCNAVICLTFKQLRFSIIFECSEFGSLAEVFSSLIQELRPRYAAPTGPAAILEANVMGLNTYYIMI